MTAVTAIEWADSTFNPWEGCQKVGPGCDHCYAETRNARFGGGVAVNWGPGAPRRRTSESNWDEPRRWQAKATAFFAEHGRRQRVFCASLADWLDNAVPIEWLVDLLDLVRTTSDLDWLLLTKRIGTWAARLGAAHAHAHHSGRLELAIWISTWLGGDPPSHVLIGSTMVDQPELDRDYPKLCMVPAARRFISAEPMLGAMSFDAWPLFGEDEKAQLHWVIVGGESGPGARPMHPDWARSLRDQCAAAGVPFLFKQWGEHAEATMENVYTAKAHRFVEIDGTNSTGWTIDRHGSTTAHMVRIGKKAAGRLLDGIEHNGFPEAACAS